MKNSISSLYNQPDKPDTSSMFGLNVGIPNIGMTGSSVGGNAAAVGMGNFMHTPQCSNFTNASMSDTLGAMGMNMMSHVPMQSGTGVFSAPLVMNLGHGATLTGGMAQMSQPAFPGQSGYGNNDGWSPSDHGITPGVGTPRLNTNYFNSWSSQDKSSAMASPRPTSMPSPHQADGQSRMDGFF